MRTPPATQEATPASDAKVQAIRDVLAEAPQLPAARWSDALAMLLVDAIIDAELPPMEVFLDEASRTAAESEVDQDTLSALAAVAHWGITRTLPLVLGRSLDLESATGRILRFVSEAPGCSSKDIHLCLNLAEATVSRVGTQMEEDGLIYRVRAGKWRRWRTTHAGENMLNAALVLQASLEQGEPSKVNVPDELKAFGATRATPDPIPLQERGHSETQAHDKFRARVEARKEARRKRGADG